MADKKTKTLGLIVNPIAGMGGRIGLKGSDDLESVAAARAQGAEPNAAPRAVRTLQALRRSELEIQILTYPHEMGAEAARLAGYEPRLLGEIESGATGPQDTRRAARQMAAQPVDLLLFVGGDGTARDIVAAVGEGPVVLGVPAGVKMHSSVFAVSPRQAAALIELWFRDQCETRLMEVMDIDEEAFRQGRLSAQLYGYLRIPFASGMVQASKLGASSDQAAAQAIAEEVLEGLAPGELLILGPGSTVLPIGEALGIEKSLLGVDVVRDGKLLAKDADEARILALLDEHPAKIVVTVIGGQGYIFGRGNQQISPDVIRAVGRQNLIVVATPDKLRALEGPMRVDTGDPALDAELVGYQRVVTGYHQSSLRKVEA
jgi:predicted polyphosphate/ATP-dependent NAD kinase